jgi:hypothetical protein
MSNKAKKDKRLIEESANKKKDANERYLDFLKIMR